MEKDSDVDLILLDLTMPGISRLLGLIYLAGAISGDPVVIVPPASDDAGTISRSLDFGASGFIPKRFGVETLRDAIVKAAMDGDVWVPPDYRPLPPPMIRTRRNCATGLSGTLTPQQVRGCS
mgnify:CR=1 FL=1